MICICSWIYGQQLDVLSELSPCDPHHLVDESSRAWADIAHFDIENVILISVPDLRLRAWEGGGE